MNNETQNRLWATLSKEERDAMRTDFRCFAGDDIAFGSSQAMEDIFGHHNLTSDKEPEEMLTVSAKKVRELHAKAVKSCANDEDSDLYYSGYIEALEDAFGKDKCLPDPNEEKPTPKFKCGDKVRVINDSDYNGTITQISGIQTRICGGFCYYLKDLLGPWTDDAIESYTEPETQQTEEDMEEKELNLAELLKGCEGDTFYSPYFGTVSIINVRPEENRLCIDTQSSFGRVQLFENGSMVGSGECVLFPSRALYLKYPLEAAKAWQIWAEERKPKRWRPKDGEAFWYINSTLNPISRNYWDSDSEDWVTANIGNCFKTQELCQQAAEAVKRTLEEFHEKNAEK